MGPHDSRSTVLTPIEEAMIAEFRRRTLLPLDDVLGCLKDSIPKLTRSSLHRCLERHGISRLPESEEKASKRGRFADTTIGYVHIDMCELRLTEGKLNIFLAIDGVSKFTYIELHTNASKVKGADFLRNLRQSLCLQTPYGAHRQWHGFRRSAEQQERSRAAISRRPHLRSWLRREPHRAQADKAISPVDEWPSRAK
jgi:hypothetical protein